MTGARPRPVSVVLAGGGTAGHIEPALAVADSLRDLDVDVRITALGTERGLETTLVPQRGYPLELIPPVPMPRKLTRQLFGLPARVRQSVKQTRAVLDRVEADVIVGFGGYVSLPAYLAAGPGILRRRRRIPIVVHEANATAGLANKVGARRAARVLTAFPDSGLPNGEQVGIPVRAAITSLDRKALRAEARDHFGLDPDAPTLLVFGGSQGARSLNEAVSAAAGELAKAGIGVLHAHGPKNTITVSRANDGPAYMAVPYLSRMDLAYAAADAVVCRSGAMTVAEVSAVGLPAVYVPLPHGNGEQELNAKPVVAAGGGIIAHDSELTRDYIIDHVIPLLTNPGRLTEMSAAAAGAGHRSAAAEVAKIVMDVARGNIA
ncbi:undecaprenyldiphospho-muramoylpentapeptide beta-N-acetylglucosaminyltransferase [Hoyosella rhizosphaerae]|uniref:UDP-N-acetylglucosamine--N-acetylmuramyl-(pentapeptide) pyrophosphoryl-undecaprenol N-acetylglucosamine transferase n=1 Tax=Hoyosella rhizosphaerae TaxID=1755582 RepID=A0A916UGF5_9ACTN|nr:undecaprenyldiphospho-muramoylpentapeptide beta-N-acetylglucosaminyltransferase [Hoyosella rhizosphaerae]MBN4927913.1 undecaprenyldiphospho-muramoylpentapeptide beta-N-acetylglucosaminyltransferase [Hoyosella rhizosphaerae]GGC70953.1 UDP-N-acetylglucosamine--N-acetylmuramyl-(pentapeptide) pyrophosphoryl-undecaprenol N-acetylglucosamine transferase [Hoyosella rhizosphaerae]